MENVEVVPLIEAEDELEVKNDGNASPESYEYHTGDNDTAGDADGHRKVFGVREIKHTAQKER